MTQRPDLTKYLFSVLAIGQTNDSVLNAITEEDLEEYLIKVSSTLSINYPKVPKEDEAIIVCLAKKEVYWKMATASAPLYALNLEGLKVDKDVRFDHYLKLIQQVEVEYNQLINDPNRVKVSVGEVIIDKPYTYKTRTLNYQLPTITPTIDKVAANSMDISLSYEGLQVRDYKKTVIYICKEPVWDKYEEIINPLATKVMTIENPRKCHFRIKDLEPNTHYYLMVQVLLNNELIAYEEIEGDTNE